MAGKRVEDDIRNKLVFSYIKFIELVEPKMILFENVKGFTYAFNKKDDQNAEPYSHKVIRKLKELGYYKGSPDGDFGSGTEDAVIAFQKANGLTADGKAGPKTLEKLYGSNAVSAKSASSDSSSSASSSAGKISKDTYLDSGKKGKDVKTLQNRLIELGWLSGSASGTYDEATEAAVIAFQKKAKLWADGKAGPKTIEALFSSKAPSGSSSSGATLELGSAGSEVKKLQKRLIDLGYLSGTADGKFGEMTETALKAFQEANGLEADGKAGTKTQNKLYSDEAVRASKSSD